MVEQQVMANQEVRNTAVGGAMAMVPWVCQARLHPSGSPATTPLPGQGATMAARQAQRLEERDRSTSTTLRRKPSLGQRAQELQAAIALQEQGRQFLVQSCEEKLSQKRGLLPKLREAVREDVCALDGIQKGSKLGVSTACGARKPMGIDLARKTVEMAQERLRGEIYDRVNTSNLLLHQLRQRSRAQDELQRRLQQLLDAEMDDKKHQAQAQKIRQLENKIEKTLLKTRAGQTVNTMYLMVRDVLKKELDSLLLHLDILSGMSEMYRGELEDMEHMALEARKAAYVAKKDMARLEIQFHMERELRSRSLAASKVQENMLWLKQASKTHLRPLAWYKFAMHSPSLEDSLSDTESEATKSQREYRSCVIKTMEDAKALMQCSCVWDIHKKIQAEQKSLVDLKQHINDCKEKKQALKKTLEELELKQAELKFRQPPNTTRILEEGLRMNLQKEEARLKQMRDQMLRNQDVLCELENAIDNLFICLYGITTPDQDNSVKATGVEEKLQHCQQKLRYLMQRVADLPPTSYRPDEDNEIFVKVRHILEKTTASDPKNLKISFDDVGSKVQEPFISAHKDHGLVLSRKDIKKQGMQLIESKNRKK